MRIWLCDDCFSSSFERNLLAVVVLINLNKDPVIPVE